MILLEKEITTVIQQLEAEGNQVTPLLMDHLRKVNSKVQTANKQSVVPTLKLPISLVSNGHLSEEACCLVEILSGAANLKSSTLIKWCQ